MIRFAKFGKDKVWQAAFLRNKAKEYAIRIVTLCRAMRKNGVEAVLIQQLLRAGTSVGANLYEAQYAQSPKDFVSKLEIALKECNESDYWVDLLHEVGNISDGDYNTLQDRIIELRRMLVSSVKTMKAKEHD